MQTMSEIEQAINAHRGARVEGQRGRKLKYVCHVAGHPAVEPEGFIVVFLGTRSRNTLHLTREQARTFLENLKSLHP